MDQAPPHVLHFELLVELTPQREGMQPLWRADLVGSRPGERRHFESLPELTAFLARLGPDTPLPRGIR
ncbi:MAG: hypothetical protein ABI699_06205 [Caldimonas sp.]